MRALRCSAAPNIWATWSPILSSPPAGALLDDRKPHSQWELLPLIESEPNCGGIQAAPICGHLQPIPCCRVPAVRAPDAEVSRPMPERRLQAVAVQLRSLGGFQGLARS